MADPIIYSEGWAEFRDCVNGICIKRQKHLKDAKVKPHWHERIEFWRIISGELNITCNLGGGVAKSGCVVVFNPYETHSATALSDSVVDVFIVDLKMLDGGPDNIIGSAVSSLLKGESKISRYIQDDEELDYILERLVNMPTDLASGRRDAMCCMGMALYAVGIMTSKHEGTTKQDGDGVTDELSDMINYMYDRYNQRLSLDEMSAYVGFSRSYFCRWFKAKTSKTPMDFINDIRVKRAYELLSVTDLPVTDVCYMTGFSDINNMNLQFKKRIGFSPSECKKIKASRVLKFASSEIL